MLVFGCAGYCRLGLGMCTLAQGDPKSNPWTIGDQKDTLVPKLVPAFSGDREVSRAASVFAGPTCSAVIDRGGMYWLAGKVSTPLFQGRPGGAGPSYLYPDSDPHKIVVENIWGRFSRSTVV